MNVTIELEEVEVDVDRGEGELETLLLRLRVSADMSYQAEKVSGPPEDCYPADSTCDITEVEVLDVFDAEGNEIKLTPALRKQLQLALEDCDFEEELWAEWAWLQEEDCDE